MLLFNNIVIYIAASVMKTSTEHEVNGAIRAFLKYARTDEEVEEDNINVHAVKWYINVLVVAYKLMASFKFLPSPTRD